MLDIGLFPPDLWIVAVALGAAIGALTGWRVWLAKDRPAWHGAVIGALLVGVLTLIGLLILLVIWTVWDPKPTADSAARGTSQRP